jgi:hypothetical protein
VGQLSDALAFFSRAFELMKAHPQHAVLRYAAVVAQRWVFPNSGWPTFQGLLFKAATADPGILPIVVALLARHVGAGQKVNLDSARRMIEAIIARHAPLGHGSEVAWALWTAIQFSVDLSSETATVVCAMEDDVVALLALDANARGRFPANAINLIRWSSLVTLPNALNDEHWLLSYESNRRGWLNCPAVKTHPFFNVLDGNQVSFYDSQRRLVGFTGAAAAVPGGKLPFAYP